MTTDNSHTTGSGYVPPQGSPFSDPPPASGFNGSANGKPPRKCLRWRCQEPKASPTGFCTKHDADNKADKEERKVAGGAGSNGYAKFGGYSSSSSQRLNLEYQTEQELVRIKARREAQRRDAIERAKTRPKLYESILTYEDMENLPEPEQLIAGVLPQSSYALLVGRDSTFKTFTALDWALCLATGTPWKNHAVSMPEDRPAVLYIAAEGFRGIFSRMKAWLDHHGKTPQDLKQNGEDTFQVLKRAVNLYQGEEIDDLVNTVGLYNDIGLVVIDTLRRASGGADQNGSDMGVVIDNISRIKEAMDGGSVLAIAHTDKNDNDTRGSSLVEDDADVVWHSKASEKDAGAITLHNRKMKDGPKHAEIKLRTVEVGSSLVLEAVDPMEAAAEDLSAVEKTVLDAVRLVLGSGQTATPARIESMAKELSSAPKDAPPPSRASVYRALKDLKNKGAILQEGQGKPYTLSPDLAEETGQDSTAQPTVVSLEPQASDPLADPLAGDAA